jgi:hypothetical protein
MLELLIGAISLAIAVGQVVAAPRGERFKTLVVATITGCFAIAALAAYQYIETKRRERHIEHVASHVLNAMDHPQTFDDLYHQMNFYAYRDVDDAFDVLFDSERAQHRVVQLQGPFDRTYAVRLFFRNGEWK